VARPPKTNESRGKGGIFISPKKRTTGRLGVTVNEEGNRPFEEGREPTEINLRGERRLSIYGDKKGTDGDTMGRSSA